MSEPRDFWSRRKQAVEAEAEAENVAQVAVEERQRQEALASLPDEELLEELGLPDPDTLEQGDDFAAFMARAVPTRLRNRALRKLWLSNPALANLDALVDYGEDFTDSSLVVENLQTTYQVGKGMAKHVLEMARQDAEAELASQQAELSGDDEAPIAFDRTDKAFEDAGDVTENDRSTDPLLLEQGDEIPEADPVFVAKRRMRFVTEAEI